VTDLLDYRNQLFISTYADLRYVFIPLVSLCRCRQHCSFWHGVVWTHFSCCVLLDEAKLLFV